MFATQTWEAYFATWDCRKKARGILARSDKLGAAEQSGMVFSSDRFSTGWSIRLYTTFCRHQNKSSVTLWTPYTKTQLSMWCQQKLVIYLMDTPVDWCGTAEYTFTVIGQIHVQLHPPMSSWQTMVTQKILEESTFDQPPFVNGNWRPQWSH